MSRVIVKNLPKKITEKKLRDLFEAHGTITDIQLKYTKEGVFRQFAFIGYRSEDEAQLAIKYFNNSCIQTNRISVEPCAALGGEEKPQSWSKHAKDSNSFRKVHGIYEKEKAEKEEAYLKIKAKKVSKFDEIIGDHKDDPQFVEFMQAHDKNRALWENDAKMIEDGTKKENQSDSEEENDKPKETLDKKKPKKEVENEEDEDGDGDDNDEDDDKKLAEKPISDLEYMKSLVKSSSAKNPTTKKEKEKSRTNIELFTIKIHNVPYKARRQDILKFFKPLKPFSLRLPTNVHGFCYVGFKTEKDFNTAMVKNKSFIKGKQVFFSDFTEKNKIAKAKVENTPIPIQSGKHLKWQQQEESVKNEEGISESGKIFFRNLAYTVVQDDLQKLFEAYGPVAEINLPVDSITRKIKGFGTVTFLMPEHAVKAFSELDGSTFHGRLLHLIPAKTSNNEAEADVEDEGLSWTEKKELKLKKAAQQTYNWNSLFLGANAVADILARQYETTKENILDSQSGGSGAAVRLALGETQIVMEMKQFLEDNGVSLDVFESQNAKRSNTVLLAKNLPADTEVSDLQPLFAQYGLIARFVFPPSGVTALIEFMDPSEAKLAFKKLAYSKFKHVPLYLEWAPEGTFKNEAKAAVFKPKDEIKNKEHIVDDPNAKKTKKQYKREDKERRERERLEEEKRKEDEAKALAKEKEEGKLNQENENDMEDDDEPPEPNTTLFLRNLNFKTKEDAVRNHFKHLGQIQLVQVATRKDPEDPRNKISLGYGFIQFKKNATAEKALRQMQFTQIEGNQVELKRSDRTLKTDEKAASARKSTPKSKQTGTKILVRNIAFQAKPNEVRDIFKAFGELRSVRLPLKMTPGEECHRGFGFVDFLSKSDAKKAFEAISQSTHLYGKRFVLEWASTTEDNVGELRKRTAQTYHRSDGLVKKSKRGLFDTDQIGGKDNGVEDDY